MLSDFWGLETPITVRKASVWEEIQKKDDINLEILENQVDAAEEPEEMEEEEEEHVDEENEQ